MNVDWCLAAIAFCAGQLNRDVLGIYENDHEYDIDAALELMKRARDQQPRNPEVYVGWGWISCE
jgi:hypothetical protein